MSNELDTKQDSKNDKREPKKILSITEAAKLNKVSRQAIYVAIKLGKLKAHKENNRWVIHRENLIAYRKQKYSRAKSLFNGELLFNNTQGFYSVSQIARILNVPVQKIYYATRIGMLKAHRKGAAWVIHLDNVKEYKEKHLFRKRNKRKAS